MAWGGVWTLLANLRGPKGEDGPQGLPGINGLPNDTALAGYVEGPSEMRTALDVVQDERMLDFIAGDQFQETSQGYAGAAAIEVVEGAGFDTTFYWDETAGAYRTSTGSSIGLSLDIPKHFIGPVDPHLQVGITWTKYDRWTYLFDVYTYLAYRWNARDLALAHNAAVAGSWPGFGGISLGIEGSPTFIVSGATKMVRTDGVDDGVMSSLADSTQPVTKTFVGGYQGTAPNSGVLLGSATSGQNQVIGTNSSGNWQIFAGNSVASAVAKDTTLHVFTAVFNGASSRLYINGTQVASGNAGTAVSDGIVAGRSATSSAYYAVNICDILVHKRALTASEVAANAAALIAEHGI